LTTHSLCSRSVRTTALALAAALTLAPSTSAADPLAPSASHEPTSESWWTPWYLVDYGLILAGTAGYVGGQAMWPRDNAIIGTRYDPDDPIGVFEAEHLQRDLRDETVDLTALRVIMTSPGVMLGAMELAYWQMDRGGGSAQRFHDILVGYAEAVAITSGVTAVTQGSFGRLRPDFGQRARNYHCWAEPEAYAEYCDGFLDEPLAEHGDPEHLVRDGRRAFFSGHAAHAFNGFTYASLALGSRYLWGPDATPASRAATISAQAAMTALATYISVTRVTDARHQTGDVIAGTLVGLGVSNLSYWRRFHVDGTPRRAADRGDRGYSLRLGPSARGAGLSLTLEH
jgi:hypothetical protein